MARYPVNLADAVWVATATLHRKYGIHQTFSTAEILEEVVEQKIRSSKNPDTIQCYINADCVANHPYMQCNSNHSKLYKYKGKYRLYRQGSDTCHESKMHCRVEPDKHNLPQKYQIYIEWYRNEYCGEKASPPND